MKTKSLHRSFLLEDRCRFLSNFSLSTADVEMPGEYLEPQVCKWERLREREERGGEGGRGKRGGEGGRGEEARDKREYVVAADH